MGKGTALASLNIVVGAVTAGLFKGLKRAQARMVAFGAKMKAIGRGIMMSFTLPFLAIGAAGAAMAISFEQNMTKINTLVGISADKVNAFAADVKKLAGETAQAPADLANGLFFLASAGLRGANAMSTLEAVSKGTAIGLGEQTDLAKVAAAAQNAYGAETLTASDALDMFGGAVKEGMFEASDLAAVLGTQLGMSAKLGISFDEVNAFIATYTKTTGDANSATTSFGGVMMALAKITPQQEKALSKISMSSAKLKDMLAEKGLRGTLIHLEEAFKAQGVPMSKFFSKSQALKGVFGVLGNQTETYGEVLEGIQGSVGMVDEGFETLSKTAGFKMKKSWNDLKMAAEEMGARLLPIFTKVVGFITGLAKGFSQLDEGKKKLLLAAGALVAFSGPLITLAGGLISILAAVLSPVGLVVVALALLFKVIYDNWGSARKIFVDFINYWIDLYNESKVFRFMVEAVGFAFKQLWTDAKFFFKMTLQAAKNFGSSFTELFGGIGAMLKGVFTGDWDEVKAGWQQFKSAFGKTFGGVEMENLAKEWGAETEKNISTAIQNINPKAKVKFITEEQVQTGIDNIKKILGDKYKQISEYMKSLIGGGSLVVPGGPEDPKDPKKKKTTPEDPTTDMRSAWQKYFDWAEEGWDGWVASVSEKVQKVAEVIGQFTNAIGGMWAAQHEKKMQILENESVVEHEQIAADMEREIERIKQSGLNEEAEKKAIEKIEKKYAKRKEQFDKAQQEKENQLKTEKAKKDKKLAIMNAIVSTAVAVVRALELGPILGPIMAVVVGAMGAAQISAIASTPIPEFAGGGIVSGPTLGILGEYGGAGSNPEVVAPLNKLKDLLTDKPIQVVGMISGNDIVLGNSKEDVSQLRWI